MSGNDLHLPNLTIRRFRGIQDLSVTGLGRVTLIAGRNGVGKTTFLDAVRAYAARGQYAVLSSILSEREEHSRAFVEDVNKSLVPDWDALFYGRRILPHSPIEIGPTGSSESLRIEATPLNEVDAGRWGEYLSEDVSDENARMLKVTFAGVEQTWPIFSSRILWTRASTIRESQLPASERCESLGRSVLSNKDIGRLWDNVASRMMKNAR